MQPPRLCPFPEFLATGSDDHTVLVYSLKDLSLVKRPLGGGADGSAFLTERHLDKLDVGKGCSSVEWNRPFSQNFLGIVLFWAVRGCSAVFL